MQKRTIILIVFLVLIALALILPYTMGGKAILSFWKFGHQNSCSDGDEGNAITVFGQTSGYLNNIAYSHGDTCVLGTDITEYYCSGVYEQSQLQSCGTSGYVRNNYCLNGNVYKDYKSYYCENGACNVNTANLIQQDCLQHGCTNGACNS